MARIALPTLTGCRGGSPREPAVIQPEFHSEIQPEFHSEIQPVSQP
ncbi:MAG: hypothetical protein WAL50_14165 [Kineosporiaceae bacterium]